MLKRVLAYVICSAVLAGALSGCAANNEKNETAETKTSYEITGTDYRVIPEHVVEITGNETIEHNSKMPDYAFLPTLESLSDVSTYMVEGEICELYYTVCDGDAWIQMDVLVSACQKGGFEQGDMISVYTSGGYVSAADHFSEDVKNDYYSDVPDEVMEKTLIEVLNNGAPLPEKGEKYLFFMADGGSTRPDGCYEVMMTYEVGMFKVQDEAYVNDNTNESFSLNELQTVVSNNDAEAF